MGGLNFTIFLGVQMLQVNLGLGTTGKSVQVVMNSVGLEAGYWTCHPL
jgi:hypothetical protein